MLVCTLDMEMVINSVIDYNLTLQADGKIIDTITNWYLEILTTNDYVHTINCDFHGHYFALSDLSFANVTTGIALNVSNYAATYNNQTNYVFFYD